MMERYPATILTLFLLLQGCSALTDSDAEWNATDFTEEGVTLSLVEYYTIENEEQVRNASPRLMVDPIAVWQRLPALQVKTNNEYGCFNHSIEYHHGVSDEQFDLQLLGVRPPEGLCLTAVGPARANVPLPERTGTWNLSIWSGSEEDRYRLRIFEDRVELETIEADYSELTVNRFYLRPENSLHLYCATKESALEACQSFETWIEEVLSLDPYEFPTDGVNPYRPGSSPDDPSEMDRFYIYPESVSFDEIRSRLETYVEENEWDEMNSWIRIYNWDHSRVFSSEFME